MHEDWAKILVWPNTACKLLSPEESVYLPLYQAIVCGTKLQDHNLNDTFRNIGIVHLVVVSGAHLAVALKLVNLATRKFTPKIRQPINILILFSYASVCLWSVPVARAFIQVILRQINTKRSWKWSPQQLTLCAGLLTTPLIFIQGSTLGLAMSWIAATCLGIQSLNSLKKCILIYALLFPLLMTFGAPSPLSILINWTVAPILALTALPFSAITFFIPWAQPLSDKYWEFTLSSLGWLEQIFPTPFAAHQVLSGHLIGVYIASIQTGAYFYEKHQSSKPTTRHRSIALPERPALG